MRRCGWLLEGRDTDEAYMHVFRLGDAVFVWFPHSPAWGGNASYGYVLYDDGRLSVIATGYGHYGNPALHWMKRGLSDAAEREIMVSLLNRHNHCYRHLIAMYHI